MQLLLFFSCSFLSNCNSMDCNMQGFPVFHSPIICSNSSPLSQWCYLTISSSIVPFSFCPRSFPASGSFPMSRLLVSDGQSIGASASASVLPINIQDWFHFISVRFSSVQFSLSVVSDSLQPHELQHTRPPCPSPAPGVNSGSLVVMPSNHLILCRPLLLPPSIFPRSGSFPMSRFFTSGSQSIGASASASNLPMNIQD